MRRFDRWIVLVLGLVVGVGARAQEPPPGFAPVTAAEARFREARGLELARDPGAVDAYRELLGSDLSVSDAVHAALGRLLPAPSAEPHWRAVLAETPASPFAVEALRALAAGAEARGDLAEAGALYRRLAAEGGDEGLAAQSLLRAAELARRRGRTAETLALAERVWVEYAHRPEARGAAELLAPRGGDPFAPVTGERILARGQTLLDKGRRTEAVRTLEELRGRLRRGSALLPEVELALGKALYFLRRYAEALEPLERAAAHPGTEEWARFYRARCRFGLDQGDEGAPDLVALARARPDSARAPQYLYQAYRVFQGRTLEAQAAAARDLLLTRYPTSDEAREVTWNDAWRAFRAGGFEAAAAGFRASTVGHGRGWLQARGRYWEARALGEAGRTGEAEAGFRALEAEYPLGYYGRLASRWLERRPGDPGLPDLRAPGDAGLRTPRPTPADAAPEGGAPARAAAYLRLGLTDAARRVLA
ncbi:MAG: hypothetical protein ACYDA8_02760, partial [Deferrisomatales bacterium]